MDDGIKFVPDKHYQCKMYFTGSNKLFNEVYGWCWQTFGHPGSALGTGQWDSHARFIKLKTTEEVLLFKLRWK